VTPHAGRRHARRLGRQSVIPRGEGHCDHHTVVARRRPRDVRPRRVGRQAVRSQGAHSQDLEFRRLVVPYCSSFVWESPALVGR
jgi:hypothetical protein